MMLRETPFRILRRVAPALVVTIATAGTAAGQSVGSVDSLLRPFPTDDGQHIVDLWTVRALAGDRAATEPSFIAALPFGPSSRWRGELELGFRGASPDREDDRAAAAWEQPRTATSIDEFSPTRLMANGIVSFDAWSGSGQLYVGGGLGITRDMAALSGKAESDPDSGGTGEPPETAPAVDEDRFTYQLMTGLFWPFTDSADLTVGYRYRAIAGDKTSADNEDEPRDSHTFEGGIVFRF